MNEILMDLKTELENVISKVNSAIPSNEPFSIAHSNWSFPGVTKNDLVSKAQEIISLVEGLDGDVFEDSDGVIADYKRRIKFLADSTIPNIWSNAALGVPNYLITLDGLKYELNRKFDRNHAADLQ